MPDPNCKIHISLFDEHTAVPRFAYVCAGSTSGWQVMPDGNILPPSRSRVLQFRPRYPSGAVLTGFQIVSGSADLLPLESLPWHIGEHLGKQIKVIAPNPFPLRQGEAPDVILDFTGMTSNLLSYRLAVNGIWDDPKIYDDGSE